jgi:hypothetical protein
VIFFSIALTVGQRCIYIRCSRTIVLLIASTHHTSSNHRKIINCRLKI